MQGPANVKPETLDSCGARDQSSDLQPYIRVHVCKCMYIYILYIYVIYIYIYRYQKR